MSCFFCNSFYHLSQNCDKYVDLDSRLLRTKSKNYCNLCLKLLDLNHCVWSCDIYKRCYQCFSTNHHTYYCPEKAKTWCIPNIDEDLFPRFLQFFDPVEYFPVAFSSPINSLQTLPLRVMRQLKIIKKRFPLDTTTANYVVSDKIVVNRFYESSRAPLTSPIVPKVIINKAKSVVLKDVQLTPANFFVLLTPFIRKLECSYVDIKPTISFADIIAAIPNVQIIDIGVTNFVIEKTWLEDLLKLKNEKNFTSLKMRITDLFFNAEALVAFMKRSKNDVKITLSLSGFTPHQITSENLNNMFSKHFTLLIFDAANAIPNFPVLIIESPFLNLSFKLID